MDKTFDAASAEPRIYARWERDGCFAAGANARPGAESFCIMLPPPNVTGSLHIGHALNHTLQDVLVRWHRMRGFDTLWQPGQDHAGIATQMVVERQLSAAGGQSRRELGRQAFLDKVWEWKAQSGDIIMNQDRRLGVSCDWSRNRFTMDEGFHDAVLRVFVGLYKDGLIYRDKRLVNWDPHFETAISDLEVEQVEVKGHLWRFRYHLANDATYDFPVVHEEIDGETVTRDWTPADPAPTAWEERNYIVVATTRPETMLGDTGVAVAPDDPRYAALVGRQVILPLVGRRIPVVADEYADPTKGTGAVKITPAHDFNDFEVGKRQGLAAINVMGPRATLHLARNIDFEEHCAPSPEAMALDGLDRFAARAQVVGLAETQGWLDGIDAETHMVPHGDRSKQPIEPYLTDQWFVDAKTLAQPALEAVRSGATKFVPQSWEKTYFQWLENIEPWCISRQLWWGHQVPVWYGPKKVDDRGTLFSSMTGGDAPQQEFCAADEEAVRADAEAYYGKPVVFVGSKSEAGEGGFPPDAPAVELWRDPDVLDTWFSSGLWPFGTLGWPERTDALERYYKTDVLVTGFDIIFFWVARMMMMGLHFMKNGDGKPEVPFHTVYVHALVRDEHGKKMSKSLGNVIDPLELIDEYGADAVRFTLASMAAMGRDIKLSVARVAGYRNFATKLWNAARFAEMNGCDPVQGFEPGSVRQPVNAWIVGETARIVARTDEALAAYRFNDAANGLYAHVWGVVCDWYVELAKPLLLEEDGPAKAETQATMAWALDQCLLLLHPIMPFVTEELWEQIGTRAGGRATPLIHADWPVLAADLADPQADEELGWVIRVIEAIRSVRAEMNVPAGAQIPLVLTGIGPGVGARAVRNAALLMRLARLSGIESLEAAPAGSVTVALEDCALNLPLAGVIDVAAERGRLDKALGKLAKEIGQLEGKLGNARFLEKAPADEVEKQRERLGAVQAERARLDAALGRLAEIG
jgi:valyl-tRNA synthetase